MTTTKLTHSISGDFAGSFNRAEWERALRGNGITRNLLRVDVSGSETVESVFNGSDPLPQADVDTIQGASYPSPIGGLIASHSGVEPPVSEVTLQGVEKTDGDKLHVHSSPRPKDMATYFSSAGDDVGIGDGPLLLFRMAAADASKQVEVSYSELVYIKDGYIVCKGAPLGSRVSAEVISGTTVVGSFVRNALMLGDAFMPFDTEDKGPLPAGLKLRITVYNSDGTGDQDPAAAFDVIARVEMYRTTTA